MDLVQIARFADLTEAQVAAAALRASGIPAVVHDESGQNYYVVQNYRLAVPQTDADDARAYLDMLRTAPRAPLEGSGRQTSASRSAAGASSVDLTLSRPSLPRPSSSSSRPWLTPPTTS
jgi:hypothetical protein